MESKSVAPNVGEDGERGPTHSIFFNVHARPDQSMARAWREREEIMAIARRTRGQEHCNGHAS
eukprot:1741971-Lingulodinium_polyedra.AAC.1